MCQDGAYRQERFVTIVIAIVVLAVTFMLTDCAKKASLLAPAAVTKS